MTLTWEEIDAARRRLDGVAIRTPVLRSRQFDDEAGASVFFKAENLQRAGAFKFRGAYNKLATLPAGRDVKTVVRCATPASRAAAACTSASSISGTGSRSRAAGRSPRASRRGRSRPCARRSTSPA